MIVLDTNVISELMRAAPDARVLAWIADQPMAGLFTTTLTQAEILYGLALLPEGGCRDALLAAAQPMFEVDLAGRVLPFDRDAALAYPDIAASRKRAGQPISQIDAQIAAIRAVTRRAAGDSQWAGFRSMWDHHRQPVERSVAPAASCPYPAFPARGFAVGPGARPVRARAPLRTLTGRIAVARAVLDMTK